MKCEIYRIRDQASPASSNLYEQPLRYLHNRWLNKAARPLSGSLVMGSKVAILILYQPKGVARSIFLTCDHLIAQGYSPFILSNAPVSASDRAELLARSALLLERRNFGYDFGAYQDGVRLLAKMGHQPDRLILMNDSTWFPLRADDTSIARMEASGDAFTGKVYKSEPKIGLGRDHMESHFLMFNRNAQQSRAFKDFWYRYPMTSSRFNTIQRGEKGISSAMFDAGFASQGLTSKNILLARLADEPFAALKKVLHEASFDPNKLQQKTQTLLTAATDTSEWRQEVLDHVRDVIQMPATTLSVTFIYFTMTKLGLGFVKKAQDDFFHLTRIKVLELEAAGEIEALDLDVRAEMSASVAEWLRG